MFFYEKLFKKVINRWEKGGSTGENSTIECRIECILVVFCSRFIISSLIIGGGFNDLSQRSCFYVWFQIYRRCTIVRVFFFLLFRMTKLQACVYVCVCVSAAVHMLRNCHGVGERIGMCWHCCRKFDINSCLEIMLKSNESNDTLWWV